MYIVIEWVTSQKNFVKCIYKAVEYIQTSCKFAIDIVQLTMNKVMLKFNDDCILTFFLRNSNGDLVRGMMDPPIAGLGQFLACKFEKAFKNNIKDLNVVTNVFTTYLKSLYISYQAFLTITDLQYTVESMAPGPNYDSVHFAFEFEQMHFQDDLMDDITISNSL